MILNRRGKLVAYVLPGARCALTRATALISSETAEGSRVGITDGKYRPPGRTGHQALRPVKPSDRVRGVAAGTGRAADRAALRNAKVPTSRSRSDVKGPGGRPVPKAERQQMTQDSNGNPVVVSRHQPHPKGGQPHDDKPHSHAVTPRIEDGKLDRRADGSVRYHE